MIKSLIVTNPVGESLTLELMNPDPVGLYVESITGLGPPKATINSNTSVGDGAIFSSSRMGTRNIVITLGMMESPLIEDARQRTYKYFPIKGKVEIEVITDRRHAKFSGYVESNEPNIFSSRETTQISILCTDPYSYEEEFSETAFFGVQPLFEFIFSNESLTENLLEFGEVRTDTSAKLIYNGDINTGVTITVHALGQANAVRIYDIKNNTFFGVDVSKIASIAGSPFSTGDDIIINTRKGQRGIQLLHDGKYTNVIGALEKNSTWFQISPGENVFGFQADGDESNLMITFSYQNAYGGI